MVAMDEILFQLDISDFPGPKWNDMEVVVRGSDSAIHIVNGKTVFKLQHSYYR
jgi:hypothetical protein